METRVGVVRLFWSPRPSLPSELSPQAQRAPALSMPKLDDDERRQRMILLQVVPREFVICTAIGTCVVEAFPTSPDPLFPNAHSVPSARMASVWVSSVATWIPGRVFV